MSKKNAMDAVEATRDTHQAAWEKLGKVIARKKALGKDYRQDLREKTSVSRKVGVYNSRLLEVEAAQTVIFAPSVADVREARKFLKTVRDISIQDAMLRSGLKLIKESLASSAGIANKVKLA